MTLVITVDQAKNTDKFCRDRRGLPYAYGGAFTRDIKRGTDCSGLVFQTAAYMQGRSDWVGNRYGSTESFRLGYKIVYDLGFRKMPTGGLGALKINPLMLVGLQHGGGGIYSHTSCTMRYADRPGAPIKFNNRGIDWESRGNVGGVGHFYYNGARAWNDRLYHDFWYLDAVLAPIKEQVVINEINATAERLGEAVTGRRHDVGELNCPDGQGRFVKFSNGYIYWSPNIRQGEKSGHRAVFIPNNIFERWGKAGYEAGPLGYPTRPHDKTADGVVQAFQGGAIYVTRVGGEDYSVIVHGAILNRFQLAGYEKGWGYPLSDERADGQGGRIQSFQRVTAHWHPTGVITTEAK